jgi:hypothetical protein
LLPSIYLLGTPKVTFAERLANDKNLTVAGMKESIAIGSMDSAFKEWRDSTESLANLSVARS